MGAGAPCCGYFLLIGSAIYGNAKRDDRQRGTKPDVSAKPVKLGVRRRRPTSSPVVERRHLDREREGHERHREDTEFDQPRLWHQTVDRFIASPQIRTKIFSR